LQIKLLGFADRIDKRNGTLRIVDYKSGKVEGVDLRLGRTSSPLTGGKDKFMQLSVYHYLLGRQYPQTPQESVIYSFRNPQAGYLPLQHLSEQEMEALLQEVVVRMLSDEPFEHNEKSAYCTFCRA
jgi:RecB family exonuclease